MLQIGADAAKEKQLIEGVLEDAWGTIGPHFVNSMDFLGEQFGVLRGLAVFSADAALETALRGLGIGWGDEVVIGDYSDPVDTFVTVNIGATPVYCDVDPGTLTVGVQQVSSVVTEHTKAVLADLPAGNPCDAADLSAFCREKGLFLIINLGGALGTAFDGKPIASYADAAVLDMSENSPLGIGLAGALVTDDPAHFSQFYAYHNCGRPFGEGATILFDQILGGDFRIDEFQASLIRERFSRKEQILTDGKAARQKAIREAADLFEPVEELTKGTSSCCGTMLRFRGETQTGKTKEEAVRILEARGVQVLHQKPFRLMHAQPFLQDPSFRKLTGSSRRYAEETHQASAAAEDQVVFVL